MLLGLRVFYDNSYAICSRNTGTALCVEMWVLLNPTSRRLASGVVSLALGCGAHISVLNFFKSGLTLNPHNKRHSFGLFISLYLCSVVDCIKDLMHLRSLMIARWQWWSY